MTPLPNLRCPLCRAANDCAAAQSGSFDTPCWCADVTVDPRAIAAIPEPQRGKACLCPRCATGRATRQRT